MKVVAHTDNNELATVFIAENEHGYAIEFLESTQPPLPRNKKWVLIISSLYGCPVQCPICDAGDKYQGTLSTEELLFQIDYLIDRRYPDRNVPTEKFKIQFARMGDPAFNDNVVEVLRRLPERYNAPGILPCISTIAPAKANGFFENLLKVKKELYDNNFQLQFSIHTTDTKLRNKIIPFPKWSFEQIADYGNKFHSNGSRKITLNFAMIQDFPVDACTLENFFDPDRFLIKLTPLNPTYRAKANDLKSAFENTVNSESLNIVQDLKQAGYDVLISIGEMEENKIGSNCGQYVSRHMNCGKRLESGYECHVRNISSDFQKHKT